MTAPEGTPESQEGSRSVNPSRPEQQRADPPPPWYATRGMLGDFNVRHVQEWTTESATEHAKALTDQLANRALADSLTAPIAELLATSDTKAWASLLSHGRLIPLSDSLVWVKPVIDTLHPAPQGLEGPVRDYGVRFASTSASAVQRHLESRGADVAGAIAVNLTSAVASSVIVGVPNVAVEATSIRSSETKRNVISGSKVFIDRTTSFETGLRLRIFSDGVEQIPNRDIPVTRGVIVDFPSAHTSPHEPRLTDDPVDHISPPDFRDADPRLAGEMLNTIDLADLNAELQRSLRAQGLGPQTSAKVVHAASNLLNELTARNRSRWWLTSGDVSNHIRIGTNLPGFDYFAGHFTVSAKLESLRLIAVTTAKSRGDLGGGLTTSQGRGGESSATYSVMVNAAGLVAPSTHQSHTGHIKGLAPLASAGLTFSRDWEHDLTSQSLNHTILNTSEEIARYHAILKVELRWNSSTHPSLNTTSAYSQADLSVPWRNGTGPRELEKRALGRVASPVLLHPEMAPPTVPRLIEPQPRFTTLQPAHSIEPRFDRPLSSRRSPNLPDPESTPSLGDAEAYFAPPKHLLDQHADSSASDSSAFVEAAAAPVSAPLALATNKGLGFGVSTGLPGSEAVLDRLRRELEDALGAARSKNVDWATADRQLSSYFGSPSLEADLSSLLSGITRTISLGGATFRLTVRGYLHEHLGTTSYRMTVNARAAIAETVSTRLGHGRSLQLGIGGAARIGIEPIGRFQLGTVAVQARGGIASGTQITEEAKTYRRMENTGHVEEYRYDMAYEILISREGHRRPSSHLWIYKPRGLMAQIAVPREHVPEKPHSEEDLARAGKVTFRRNWPRTPTSLMNLSDGTSGLYPTFLHSPELRHLGALLLSNLHRLPTSWLHNQNRWPEALINATRPAELAAYFGQLTSNSGRTVFLPDVNGWHTALTIRLRAYNYRKLPAAMVGGPTEIEQYSQAVSRQGTSRRRQATISTQAALGPQLRFGSDSGNDVEVTDHQSDTGAHTAPPGGRFTLQAHGASGLEVGRRIETHRGFIEVTRATYENAVAYRADPVYELTVTRWRHRLGQVEELSRTLSVSDGMDILIPDRRVSEVLAPPSKSAPPPAPVSRAYVGDRLPVTASHVELLKADGVLDEILRRLTARGVLRQTASRVPLGLRRHLQASFRSDALKARWSDLTDGGLELWIPFQGNETSRVSGYGGTTHYLWVNVSVARMDAAFDHRERPDVRLTLRGESTVINKVESRTGRSHGGGIQATGRGGSHSEDSNQQGHAGADFLAGYASQAAHFSTAVTKNVDIYRANTKDATHEFTHRLGFRIQLGTSVQLPEAVSALRRAGIKAAEAVSNAFGRPGVVQDAWHDHQPWTWRDDGAGAGREVPGQVRVLVPSHMTVKSQGPSPNPLMKPLGQQPRWIPREVEPRLARGVPPAVPSSTGHRNVTALLHELHPWDVPAADAVRRWTKVVAGRFRNLPNLAEIRGQSSINTTTPAGTSYNRQTSHPQLRAHIAKLLDHAYEVEISGRTVTVGFNLTSAKPLHDSLDVKFKARRYQQADTDRETGFEQTRGWHAGWGPEMGGGVSQDAVLVRSPFDFKYVNSDRSSGGIAETLEHNREGVRQFRYFEFDLVVVMREGLRAEMHVDVPGGLVAMLPVENGKLSPELESELPHLFALTKK
ncbi:hypothetical protein ACWGJX_43755 [Streptomyces sp. NPDC054775]